LPAEQARRSDGELRATSELGVSSDGRSRVLERPSLVALTDEPTWRRRAVTLHPVRVVVRVDDEGRLQVRPIGCESSHLLGFMALANALSLVPDGEGVAAEKPVRVILLDAGELEGEGTDSRPPPRQLAPEAAGRFLRQTRSVSMSRG